MSKRMVIMLTYASSILLNGRPQRKLEEGTRNQSMRKTSKTKLTADKIAEKASCGEDISAYFTNKFTVVRSVHRTNVCPARAVRLDEGRPTKAEGEKVGGEPREKRAVLTLSGGVR